MPETPISELSRDQMLKEIVTHLVWRAFGPVVHGARVMDLAYAFTAPDSAENGPKTTENNADSAQNRVTRASGDIAHLSAILERLERVMKWPHSAPRPMGNLPLYPNEQEILHRLILEVLKPPMLVMKGALNEADLMRLLQPGTGIIRVAAPRYETEMDDVLDSYRLAGRLCGVQVIAVDHVVCWTGDIQETLTEPKWKAWGMHSAPAMFHQTYGAEAIEDAAKWLRSQLPPPSIILESADRPE